jgi:Outer membrane receptor for ferrienterochelin and colicins
MLISKYIRVIFLFVLVLLTAPHLFAAGDDVTSKDSVALEEVLVRPKTLGTVNFRTTALQTQKITEFELTRAACCSLAESFETNPSVDVSYSDAVTGAKQIRLLGLDGEYVQLLTENFPNFRGLATPYGLDYVPGPWMESIYVSKGTSSVKNGYESITGQINLEYKKPPFSDVLTTNLFAADNGRIEANADASHLFNEKLSTGLFLHYSTERQEIDHNNDSFLDIPQRQQVNLMNRWYFKNDEVISQAGVQYLYDERKGGQTFGLVAPESSYSLYQTDLNVNRISFFTKNGTMPDPVKKQSFALIVTGSYHDQDALYGNRRYDAEELNLHTNLMYEKEFNLQHKLNAGLSYNYLNLAENATLSHPLFGKESTGGTYLEYTFNKDYKFILLAGLRADYSSMNDFFVTPRIHLKYNFSDYIHLRASAGKGFRTPLLMAENTYLMASGRKFVFEGKLDQEEAWNYGLNLGFYIPVNGNELTINTEWYYTDFQKQVVVDLDTDPHEVSFYNLDGRSYSSVFQVEASYPFFRGFNLTAAYRWMDVKTTYQGILKKKPLTSDYKALITASYQTPMRKWQFDLTSQFNGGGRMPEPSVQNPLWDKDFSSYTILNAQVSRFFRVWSIYTGVENILDFTQKNRIIAHENPWHENFDASMVWGPVHGRKFYVGLRYHIPRF